MFYQAVVVRVSPCDFDKDGDLDFIAGVSACSLGHSNPIITDAVKQQLDKYSHATKKAIPEMVKHTMVTASVWADIDKDGDNDLIVANEWGPIELFENNLGTFKNESKKYGLSEKVV